MSILSTIIIDIFNPVSYITVSGHVTCVKIYTCIHIYCTYAIYSRITVKVTSCHNFFSYADTHAHAHLRYFYGSPSVPKSYLYGGSTVVTFRYVQYYSWSGRKHFWQYMYPVRGHHICIYCTHVMK